MQLVARAATVVSLALTPAMAAWSQTAGGASEQLGKVEFSNSCSAAVQEKFLRGVAMLHSFWYSAAAATFEQVAAEDPSCAIAAWGFASILMSNPLAGQGASPKDAPRAQAAIEKGRKMGAKTQRERDYIEAVAAYYEDFGKHTERERQQARAVSYEKLALHYPKDDEAQIFYALYLAGTQSLGDPSYAASLKAASILEEQFRKHPQHPGVAHYLIHAYDFPVVAEKGLTAARLYAKIAPSAPHALHMPSHIFTRVGAWTDSAATNARSFVSAVKGDEPNEAWHASDYRVYALLQLARDAEARKTYADAQTVTNFDGTRPVYSRAAIPARIAIERGDWKEAAGLAPVESKFPYTDALVYFARAIGAARSGDPAAAEKEIETLRRLHGLLLEAKNSYWGTEVEVSALAAQGWMLLARGNASDAEERMRQAANMEDKNEKSIVTPGRILPARELLGDMLIELKRPADALKEYEQSHKREPNRFRGLYGAAVAAEQSGDGTKAKRYYAHVVKMAGQGDPRPELVSAKAYLAAH